MCIRWIVGSPFPEAAATTEPRLAIGGYDTVAYFTDGKPVQGSPEFQTVWHDARWQFASIRLSPPGCVAFQITAR